MPNGYLHAPDRLHMSHYRLVLLAADRRSCRNAPPLDIRAAVDPHTCDKSINHPVGHATITASEAVTHDSLSPRPDRTFRSEVRQCLYLGGEEQQLSRGVRCYTWRYVVFPLRSATLHKQIALILYSLHVSLVCYNRYWEFWECSWY